MTVLIGCVKGENLLERLNSLIESSCLALFLVFFGHCGLIGTSLDPVEICERKSGKELEEPFINLILKSNIESKACHRAKICFEATFLTSFSKTFFAGLQSMRKRNGLFKISL